MSRETTSHTLIVAGVLCIVCSVVVSAAAVGLRPKQAQNKELDRRRNILAAAHLLDPSKSVDEVFESRVEDRVVDLSTGEYVNPGDVPFDLKTYDQTIASRNPEFSMALSPDEDIAGIGRREKYSHVYLVKGDDGKLKTLVLPIYGKGLWSTLYGFLALDADLHTIAGITFYQHGETPGLGGEIDNPKWKALWPGKQAFDKNWNVVIEVIKGQVDPASPKADHEVDGLSGATITTRGVSHLVEFWLGERGFGPYLENLRKSE